MLFGIIALVARGTPDGVAKFTRVFRISLLAVRVGHLISTPLDGSIVGINPLLTPVFVLRFLDVVVVKIEGWHYASTSALAGCSSATGCSSGTEISYFPFSMIPAAAYWTFAT